MSDEGGSVDLAAIREVLAAATPGPWYSGIDLDGPANYWTYEDVYAMDADPQAAPLDYTDDPENAWTQIDQWADVHEIGVVATTHNWRTIPAEQHDANNRLIARAPEWLTALCNEVERLRTEQLDRRP
jgi:hypothetical protein